MLVSALGVLGATLSMTLPWPQVWRSVARRRTSGLSATACWLGVAMPIGWITYGLLIGDRIQVLTNAVTGGAGSAVLVALLLTRLDLRGRKLLVSAAAGAGVLTAAVLCAAAAALPTLDGPHAARILGAVLAVTSLFAAIPQPLSLLRDRTQDLSGLSPLRWRLALAACATWLAYGVSVGQTAVWASASVGLVSALIVCTVLKLRAPARTPRVVRAARASADYPSMAYAPVRHLVPA